MLSPSLLLLSTTSSSTTTTTTHPFIHPVSHNHDLSKPQLPCPLPGVLANNWQDICVPNYVYMCMDTNDAELTSKQCRFGTIRSIAFMSAPFYVTAYSWYVTYSYNSSSSTTPQNLLLCCSCYLIHDGAIQIFSRTILNGVPLFCIQPIIILLRNARMVFKYQ